METLVALVANLGKVRQATLSGREYLIAPLVTIVPGVLEGSEGPLFYPEEDTAESVDAWNMMPIVANHPKDKEGNPVSARQPEVIDNYGVGFVFHSTYDGKLSHEAWFDVLSVRKVEPRIEKKLLAKQPIEVSTGLGLHKQPAPEGSVHNGKIYTAIARNFKPDHLAVLIDSVGACSVKDGCGVLTNSKTPTKHPGKQLPNNNEGTMDRKGTIKWLVTNCSCWKTKEDQATLNSMSDKQLQNLQKTVENASKYTTLVNNAKNIIAGNADDASTPAGYKLADLAKFFEVSIDPSEDPVGFIKELRSKIKEVDSKLAGGMVAELPEEEIDEDIPADDGTIQAAEQTATATNKGKTKPTPPRNTPVTPQKQSFKQWEESMPPEARAIWNSAKTLDQETRESLVKQIITNSANNGLYADDEEKKADYRELMAKSVPELKKLVKRLGTTRQTNNNSNDTDPLPDWLGSVGGPVVNSAFDINDELPQTRIDFSQVNNGTPRKKKTANSDMN